MSLIQFIIRVLLMLVIMPVHWAMVLVTGTTQWGTQQRFVTSFIKKANEGGSRAECYIHAIAAISHHEPFKGLDADTHNRMIQDVFKI